jgi:hypothetical protein
MMLNKLAIAFCLSLVLETACLVGGMPMVRTAAAQDVAPAAAQEPAQRDKLRDFALDSNLDASDPMLLELLKASRERFDAQRAYYEEGRLTIDRFIDACKHLERARVLAAKNDVARIDIRKAHLKLLEEVENREKAELAIGKSTIADVSEIRQARLESEYELKAAIRDAAERASILRRLAELERKVDELVKQR